MVIKINLIKKLFIIILATPVLSGYCQKDTLFFNKGNKKEKAHDYMGAIADWSKALELNSKFEVVYYKRAVAEVLFVHDYRAAIRDFSKVIELNPGNELAYVNRGQSEYALHGYKYAIADYTKAIELNPNNGYAYCSRAVANYDSGQKSTVCSDFNKAISLGYKQAIIIKKDYCK